MKHFEIYIKVLFMGMFLILGTKWLFADTYLSSSVTGNVESCWTFVSEDVYKLTLLNMKNVKYITNGYFNKNEDFPVEVLTIESEELKDLKIDKFKIRRFKGKTKEQVQSLFKQTISTF